MKDEHPRTFLPVSGRRTAQPAASCRGFKLVELMLVVAVAGVIMAMSLPAINRTITSMHLSSSATSIAGVIQSTRYQAIATGCPYEVAITASSGSYQISTEQVVSTSTAPVCSSTYSYVCASKISSTACPVVFANSDVIINANQTLVLNPGGTISTTTTITTPSTFTIVFSIANGSQTKTVTVSGVGNVSIK
jgi:prepilin-type N-terminal cleavage/methylation domain-containing protein